MLIPILAATFFASSTLTALTPTAGQSTGLPQYPSVTPDGSHVVWSAGGDLFSAPTGGGAAERLTGNPANDLGSAISPDGNVARV